MLKLSHEERLNLMRSLNWDYLDKHEDMLEVIEGKRETSGAFTRDKLFVRSLERLPWHYVTALWGIETIKELYTPEIARRIWPKDRRYHFDFALAVLRREPLPPSRWGTTYFISERNRFFSDRGYSSKPGVL
ncbi:MAG: hypothetical protein FWB86_05165 [Treponema sp.]|nr:hypothetical protein [Treponema sp.]MCL2251055.1 hypothetical protein [Treponema sp.]